MTDLTPSILSSLESVWARFESELSAVPIVSLVESGRAEVDDYKMLVLNLRQQVIEGGCWITRAASNFDEDHFDFRSSLIGHAAREHRDFLMLDKAFQMLGGTAAELRQARKNVGSEALSAFIYHQASAPNPVHLLGALFIIEGLGARKARGWAARLMQSRGLGPEHLTFLEHHADHDTDHVGEMVDLLAHPAVDETQGERIVRAAEVTARLYRLQLEELEDAPARTNSRRAEWAA